MKPSTEDGNIDHLTGSQHSPYPPKDVTHYPTHYHNDLPDFRPQTTLYETALEFEEQAELSSADSGSTYELLNHTTISLPSKSTLDEPSLTPTTAANAILHRNRYRSAQSELVSYVLYNYLPTVEDTADWPCAFAQEFDYSSDSEESETSSSDLPAHLDTPEPRAMMQKLRNLEIPKHWSLRSAGPVPLRGHWDRVSLLILPLAASARHESLPALQSLVLAPYHGHQKVPSPLVGQVSNWPSILSIVGQISIWSSIPATMDPVPGVDHHPRNQHSPRPTFHHRRPTFKIEQSCQSSSPDGITIVA
ncbi:hypothetical protein PCANC_08356 [Puccinia coronata f. sp. avenae]|uniref:Uncharacterized protein n=1 Tax=Puccinia coronata f. sp. avenae TaxID=200324 RepID=A0A2N5T4M6_9BASI|nr:hypothetical protein PCANC_08356 [Puccinia coronata f. sp. avenae]